MCTVTNFLGCFGLSLARFLQLSRDILSGEPPLKRLSDGLIMASKASQTFGKLNSAKSFSA
jgi:hypothetical protein